ncbi:ABC transporter permease [Anaerocolumna cellulosilytica]|uniref:ABC transporter permease n=1 Tax=Anaerocolumna cellulosilytica TaxID=433286 RepID=A0A6S6RAC1_9FIRM|nr:ABC transporter permease [Anaerocolumna cellulosilytica]MBB5195108.1 fluoroquinolone transport system permease protein [Anaerocolumna cellulosilytica]BCJ96055.1 ABC transporter permease [Anaerocolumna cellulosilytica]
MRINVLLIGDIRFQFKYGFYFLYLIFTILYIGLLFALPESWREQAAILMIFTDPAAMGLFFMGAIVLFEKGERVLDSLAISPVRPIEYVVSKLLSIAIISTVVGLLIGLGSGIITNPLLFIIGVFLGSCLFSAIGLLIASNITTLNQFIVATIPAEIIINVPAIAYIFGLKPSLMIVHPGVCIIELCQNGDKALPATFILILWTILSVLLTHRVVTGSLHSLGGVKP